MNTDTNDSTPSSEPAGGIMAMKNDMCAAPTCDFISEDRLESQFVTNVCRPLWRMIHETSEEIGRAAWMRNEDNEKWFHQRTALIEWARRRCEQSHKQVIRFLDADHMAKVNDLEMEIKNLKYVIERMSQIARRDNEQRAGHLAAMANVLRVAKDTIPTEGRQVKRFIRIVNALLGPLCKC